MPRQEGGMVKLKKVWKRCWKKGGASANFRRWSYKLDQVASSSTAAVASTSASHPLFSIGMSLMVYLVFASMLYDVPSRGFKLSHLLSFDLSGAVERSLHQDMLKVQELFGEDPLRQDLLVKPSDGGPIARKDVFDSIWLLHGEVENLANRGGAPGIPGTCVAAEGSSACAPPGALAYWRSAQEYAVKIHNNEDLLTSLQAKELYDGRPVVPGELFGGYTENGISGAKTVLLSYFLNATLTEKKLNSWENAMVSAMDLPISNINVEVRTPFLEETEETLKCYIPWALCSLFLCGLSVGALCSKSLQVWKNAQSRLLLGLASSVIGALGGIGAVGVCITLKIEVDGTVLFLIPALCTLIVLHSLVTLTMLMDEVRLMLPNQASVSMLLHVATKVAFLPIALPLLSIAFAVALCASGVSIPGIPIQMPLPYAIRSWLWAVFAGIISCLVSSFVVLPGLIGLDEARQARKRLEILFCSISKTTQPELPPPNSNRSLHGRNVFNKVGSLLMPYNMSGKAMLVVSLALCGVIGWFYNTSRLEMDFNMTWPRVVQELVPSSNVASFWAEAEAEKLAQGENWARATLVMEDVKFHTLHARESILKLEQDILSDNRTSVEGVDSWLTLMMKWCQDTSSSVCDEDNWESSEDSFYNSLTLFLSSDIGKRYSTDFVATVDKATGTSHPHIKAARTHLWHNSISRHSISAVREVSASAIALNADIFPFLVVQSPEYLWFDAMDNITSIIRSWDILFCATFALFCVFFLGTIPSIMISILGAAIIFWGIFLLGMLLPGFKMGIFQSAAIISVLPVTLTCAMSAVIAFAQHPLGAVPASQVGEKIRSRIGTWGVSAGRICIVSVVGALPLALSTGRGVIFQSVLILACSAIFGLLTAVLALQLITKTLNDGGTTYKVQVQLLERMYDKQKPPSVAVYFSQIQQTPPSSLQHIRKNKALSGKLGNKGSLSDMFREEVVTLPKYVYGGDNEESIDDSSSLETNAIPINIINRRASIEDDRPLGAEGEFSILSTPPPSPPYTPHPWKETDTLSVSSTVSKPYDIEPNVLSEPEQQPNSFLIPISSNQDSSSRTSNHHHPTPISVILRRNTMDEDGRQLEEEPNSTDPLTCTPPPPPPPQPPTNMK